MKYIIVSANKRKGVVGDDAGNNHVYTELGWEVVGTRLDCIRMLQRKEISSSDVIVTQEDRKFMYSRIFDSVISCDEFANMSPDPSSVISLVDNIDQSSFLNHDIFYDPSSPKSIAKYRWFREDFDLITKFDFADISHLPVSGKFFCVCLRYRDHNSYKNSKDDFWDVVLKRMVDDGAVVFLVGKGSDRKSGEKRIHISKLAEYASLISHPNCRATVGSATGTMLFAHFCCRNSIWAVDHAGMIGDQISLNNAVYGGNCVKFMDIPYNVYRGEPNVNEFVNAVMGAR